MDGPRVCPFGLEAAEAEGAGRGTEAFPVRDDRGLGIPGVAKDLETLADFSDIGGEGGVGVSESPEEEAVLAGGVSNVGDEALVVVGDNSERGDAEMAIGCRVKFFSRRAKLSVAFRNFSLVMSVSILRSDSSSRNLCASIRRLSRSCSPVRISSSRITPRSMV